MAGIKDINKDTIMKMLRLDVFGFGASVIEEKAKMLYNVVSGGGKTSAPQRDDIIVAGGYVRNLDGFILLSKMEAEPAKKSKKK